LARAWPATTIPITQLNFLQPTVDLSAEPHEKSATLNMLRSAIKDRGYSKSFFRTISQFCTVSHVSPVTKAIPKVSEPHITVDLIITAAMEDEDDEEDIDLEYAANMTSKTSFRSSLLSLAHSLP
jgi:hypothetical protein